MGIEHGEFKGFRPDSESDGGDPPEWLENRFARRLIFITGFLTLLLRIVAIGSISLAVLMVLNEAGVTAVTDATLPWLFSGVVIGVVVADKLVPGTSSILNAVLSMVAALLVLGGTFIYLMSRYRNLGIDGPKEVAERARESGQLVGYLVSRGNRGSSL